MISKKKYALMRAIPESYIKGIKDFYLTKSGKDAVLPDIILARKQHKKYGELLESLGYELIILSPEEKYPDSPFPEDPFVVISKTALMTIPGAKSRQGEGEAIERVLKSLGKNIIKMQKPATCDCGDVLKITDEKGKVVKIFVGLSERTNISGFKQLQKTFVELEGFDPGNIIAVPVNSNCLHLKTAATYLGNGILLVDSTSVNPKYFKEYGFDRIFVPEIEKYAANCIRIGEYIIMPSGYPQVKQLILNAFLKKSKKIKIKEIDMSEFEKVDGGLTCLSILFDIIY